MNENEGCVKGCAFIIGCIIGGFIAAGIIKLLLLL